MSIDAARGDDWVALGGVCQPSHEGPVGLECSAPDKLWDTSFCDQFKAVLACARILQVHCGWC